ncbi:unnamed protein product [Medioppia subpectinata]|uniref:Nuclear receptor domain-containing protein n=1 Tax=Medioppia subpectinata TaxID=1979941 RepID=A0A7R9PUY6_9ACAR|nr:unnamed protein product [Medioppia subpectinata]CAG2101294.1 unnamed protein product [Medioppia subpectinata]
MRNFCALSCESCKAFFRRNANNLNKFKCRFENNFEMNVEMRTEVLMTDEEKEVRKRKMQKNKQKLFTDKNNVNKTNGKIDITTDSSSTSPMVVTDSEETDNTLDLQIRELEDILWDESSSSTVSTLPTNCDTIPAHIICHTFNESEGMKFNELMAATYDERLATIPIITTEVSDVWEGIKMLTLHCELGEEWRFPGDDTVQPFRLQLQCTPIILFDTNHPNITHRKNVKFQQNVYIHLLQRYLLMKYQTESVAKEKLTKLLNQIRVMRDLQQKCINYGLNLCPPDISPLLNEICDRDCP